MKNKNGFLVFFAPQKGGDWGTIAYRNVFVADLDHIDYYKYLVDTAMQFYATTDRVFSGDLLNSVVLNVNKEYQPIRVSNMNLNSMMETNPFVFVNSFDEFLVKYDINKRKITKHKFNTYFTLYPNRTFKISDTLGFETEKIPLIKLLRNKNVLRLMK